MNSNDYPRASKYPDLDAVYAQCSGPGALKLAEFLAQRLDLSPGQRLLDVGCNRGYQSCFLAKEYDVQVVAIDPWPDRDSGRPMSEHVRDNAIEWGVEGQVLPLDLGVPTTTLVEQTFDAAYSTTALEMVRAFQGEEGYRECLASIQRALRPGALFALAEPMHRDCDIPPELEPLISQAFGWKACFRSLAQTSESVIASGFEIIESGHAADAREWWSEYALHDPFCQQTPEEDPHTLAVDAGRWVSFGYVIAKKARVSHLLGESQG